MNRCGIGILLQFVVFAMELHGRPSDVSVHKQTAPYAIARESHQIWNGRLKLSANEMLLPQQNGNSVVRIQSVAANDDATLTTSNNNHSMLPNTINIMMKIALNAKNETLTSTDARNYADERRRHTDNYRQRVSAVFLDEDVSGEQLPMANDIYYYDYDNDGLLRTRDDNDGNIEPDERETVDQRLAFENKATSLCAATGRTYCEDIDGYPADHIKSLLQRNGHLEDEWNAIPVVTFKSRMVASDAGYIDDHNMAHCDSNATVIYPKYALSVTNHWNYVINEGVFVQGVHIELCTNNNKCQFSSILPIGYKSECRQKYMERMLLGLDKDGNTAKYVFKLPSHCECVLRRSGWV